MGPATVSNDPPYRRPPRRRSRLAERNSLVALLLFIPPSLIVFVTFFVLPMIDAGGFSFFDWSGYGPMTDFVGLKNYRSVLEHRNFLTSVRNSLLVVAVSLLIQLPLALWCALALVEKGWGINALRLLFFVPVHARRSGGGPHLALRL